MPFIPFQPKPSYDLIILGMSPVLNPTGVLHCGWTVCLFRAPARRCLKPLPHHTPKEKRETIPGYRPTESSVSESISSRKNDERSLVSWPSVVLPCAARSWQGIHHGEFLLLISSEQSGQAGVGQGMCKVTRAWCHRDSSSLEVLAGSTSKRTAGPAATRVRSLWWDTCHLPSWWVLRGPFASGGCCDGEEPFPSTQACERSSRNLLPARC